MWIVYSGAQEQHYPLEIGYRLIESSEICHDYDRITSFCRGGCPDYWSGGCPPHAPRVADVIEEYPWGILLYAKFYSRFKPQGMAAGDFALQDIVLSDILNQLGYAVLEQYQGRPFFLTCGHCRGCGEETCSYKTGGESCRRPERRAYSIAATGVDVTRTLKNVFGITLQWIKGENQVEYLIKVIGLLSNEPALPGCIGKELKTTLNRLQCVQLPSGA